MCDVFLSDSLWNDLQTLCCKDGVCNFHNNQNVNCSAKVSKGVLMKGMKIS